jgi:hypothetical protein
VSKILEQTLTDDFGLVGLKLSQQIDRLQGRLDDHVLSDMKQLAHWRNKLVHDPDVNSLGDLGVTRSEFRTKFSNAQQSMNAVSTTTTTTRMVKHENKRVEIDGWSALAVGVGALLAGGLAVAAASEMSGHSRVICDRCGTRRIREYGHKCRLCGN